MAGESNIKAEGGVRGRSLSSVELIAETAARTNQLAQSAAIEAALNIVRDIEQVAQLADANEHLVRENSKLSCYLSELSDQLTGELKKPIRMRLS